MAAENDNGASILEHLDELRSIIIRSLVAITLLAIAIGMFASQKLLDLFVRTFCGNVDKLYYNTPLELFILNIKISIFLGFAAAIPYIAWNLWKFISPGLYKSEKKLFLGFSLTSSFLFVVGALFALFAIFPLIMDYAVGMGSNEIVPLLNIRAVVGMALLLMLGFGVSFQMPLIVFILVRSGIVSLESVKKARPYIIVFVFILAAVLTPPDVISQIALALPTWGLFEITVLFLGMKAKKKKDE